MTNAPTFFAIYKIPEGFKVAAATMYISDSVAHWYQAYKMTNVWHNWEQFRDAVITEFEGNSRSDKMRELLLLRQTGSVEDYKRKFDALVYQIRLYDHSIGELMLTTMFVLGLKEELRATVEIQMPPTVAAAATYAYVQEGVLERTRKFMNRGKSAGYGLSSGKTEGTVKGEEYSQHHKTEKGELWKAKQLKEYRRSNGLCFRCGDKYTPSHKCQTQAQGQIKAMQAQEILSDDILDAVVIEEDEEEMQLSLNAIIGADHPKTLRVRALIENQVMLMLIDSGSSHSFINTELVERLGYTPTRINTMTVKVANGEIMYCDKVITELR